MYVAEEDVYFYPSDPHICVSIRLLGRDRRRELDDRRLLITAQRARIPQPVSVLRRCTWVRVRSGPTEFGIPVLGSLVHDISTGFVSLGMGVGTDAVFAAEMAYAEALQLQRFVPEYDDPTEVASPSCGRYSIDTDCH